jgi:hypothetical protein
VQPAFNWYPKWIELNEKGQPKNPIKDCMSQPPTIKILWSTSDRREMSCEVTPEKGLYGPEYALSNTIPDFEKKLLVHWEKYHKEDPGGNGRFPKKMSQLYYGAHWGKELFTANTLGRQIRLNQCRSGETPFFVS